MAVKMRLTRMGDKKSPFYRVVVIDSRKAQSGEYIDKIGYIDTTKNPQEVNIDVEKAKSWLSKGVQPTETVKSYLVKVGAMRFADKKDQIEYKVEEKENAIEVTVLLDSSDMGKVIGKQGKIAKALRTIVSAYTPRESKKYFIEIKEKA